VTPPPPKKKIIIINKRKKVAYKYNNAVPSFSPKNEIICHKFMNDIDEIIFVAIGLYTADNSMKCFLYKLVSVK
jgi:hypothetical protein